MASEAIPTLEVSQAALVTELALELVLELARELVLGPDQTMVTQAGTGMGSHPLVSTETGVMLIARHSNGNGSGSGNSIGNGNGSGNSVSVCAPLQLDPDITYAY